MAINGTRQLGLCGILALGLGGCVGDDDADPGRVTPELRRLCDGSSTLRLAYRNGGGGQQSPEQQLTARNGFRVLFVDGKCRYWAWGSGDRPALDDVITGTLSADEETELSTDVRFDEWPTLDGDYATAPIADGSGWSLSDGTFEITVSPSAGASAATPDVTAMVANAGRWVARLEAAGTPVVDSVRATLIAYEDGGGPSFDHQTTHAWPLSSDPTSLARSESEAYERVLESSTVIPMPDAEALRVLRRAVRDEASALNGGYVPIVTESGARFGLYVSDVLPFEGDDGRVVF